MVWKILEIENILSQNNNTELTKAPQFSYVAASFSPCYKK